MADNEQRLLRRYIRESLVSELDLSDVTKGVKGILGFGSGTGTIDKWFSNFMSRQLDSVGKSADKFIGQKLDQLLPSDVLKNIEKYSKKSGESSSTVLAKLVSGWIDEADELFEVEFSNDEKKQIYQFATDEYANALKKDNSSVKNALDLVKRKLDAKYGTRRANSKEKIK